MQLYIANAEKCINITQIILNKMNTFIYFIQFIIIIFNIIYEINSLRLKDTNDI